MVKGKYIGRDIIAALFIAAGVYLKVSGIDGTVGVIWTSIAAFYFGSAGLAQVITATKKAKE